MICCTGEIDLSCVDLDTRCKLAFALSRAEYHNIRSDVLQLSRNKSLCDLIALEPTSYLEERNPVLQAFLGGLLNLNTRKHKHSDEEVTVRGPPFRIESPADLYKFSKVTESCMGLTTQVNVLPFHFREIILVYTRTGSKLVTNLLASSTPYASTSTLIRWSDALAAQKGTDTSFIDKDVLVAVDNNQIFQRRWQILLGATAKCNVLTIVVSVEIGDGSKLQWKGEFAPHKCKYVVTEEHVHQIANAGDDPLYKKVKYEQHLHPWLSGIIEQVRREQKASEDRQTVLTDCIDINVGKTIHQRDFKSCNNCGEKDVPKRARVCPKCKSSLSGQTTESTRPGKQRQTKARRKTEQRVILDCQGERCYVQVVDEDAPQPPQFHVEAPIFVNPCSVASVAHVFREVGKRAGIETYGTGKRQWLVIVCDGLPYVIGHRLLGRFFKCGECQVHLNGKKECAHHTEEAHKNAAPDYRLEFEWVLLQPGPGHIEMNMLRSYVKLNWEVFWEELTEVFNFKSDAAKKSAYKVNDHHKGWTLARIAREAAAKELVLPFVRTEMAQDHSDFSSDAFLKYVMTTTVNPNYAYMIDAVFDLLDCIFLYRAGTRASNFDQMDAARGLYAKVWVSRGHCMYRELELADRLWWAQMPDELASFVKQTVSFNISGEPLTGEGADFRLEEINKSLQHLVGGTPTPKKWETACENYNEIQSIRDAIYRQSGVPDPKTHSGHKQQDIEQQVVAFRTLLRERKYLLNPGEECDHVSLKGDKLDTDMVEFGTTSSEKWKRFSKQGIIHLVDPETEGSAIPFNEPPIFVTPRERQEEESVVKKTIKDIRDLCERKMAEINDDDMRNSFETEFQDGLVHRSGKKTVKADYVKFYELLVEYLDVEVQTLLGSANLTEELDDDS